MIRPIFYYEVSYGDPSDEEINEMLDYCTEFGLSLDRYDAIDVSDVSYKFDTIAYFRFKDEKDAVIFKLRWGSYL